VMAATTATSVPTVEVIARAIASANVP
jgi:hypothetical protein